MLFLFLGIVSDLQTKKGIMGPNGFQLRSVINEGAARRNTNNHKPIMDHRTNSPSEDENRSFFQNVSNASREDRVKIEATFAMEEFEQIVEEEEDRIRIIGEEENERVMKVLREKEEDVCCPLCLEDLPALSPKGKAPTILVCCGTCLCRDCGINWGDRQVTSREAFQHA